MIGFVSSIQVKSTVGEVCLHLKQALMVWKEVTQDTMVLMNTVIGMATKVYCGHIRIRTSLLKKYEDHVRLIQIGGCWNTVLQLKVMFKAKHLTALQE